MVGNIGAELVGVGLLTTPPFLLSFLFLHKVNQWEKEREKGEN